MEETKQISYEVAIHKAGLPLRDGESLNEFTQQLRDSGSQTLTKKLNLVNTEKNYSSVYMVEAFGSAAIFEVYKSGPNISPNDRMRFYAMKYSRDDSGGFQFDNMTEVQRVTRFEQKKPAQVMKSVAAEQEVAPGWQKSVKGLWDTVL